MNKFLLKNKLLFLQIGFILIFIIFLLFLLLPKNYTRNYVIDNIEIFEEYRTSDKTYYFTFKKGDKILDFLSNAKYSSDRKLITKIDLFEVENNNFCLVPNSEKIDFKPVCINNDMVVHFSLANDELKSRITKYLNRENKLIETWDSYDIYSKDFTYLLWNYNGFSFINKETKKKINILDKELYNINNVGYTKDYLIIPDYNSDYTFNNYYTINFKDGNLKKQKLDRNIYFDSYFIGYLKNKAYIVDNKESTMYEFDAKKGKLEKIKAKILDNGIWKNVNIKTLLNNKQEFSYKTNYIYSFIDNNIYLSYKDSDIKKLIATDVTSIVRINDSDIYYLKKDTLYHFNENIGEEKLITHYEWNFNSDNIIYIN